MSDPSPSPHDEQVRRLLAEARHDEPIPAEVGARLDGVLADLAAERAGTPAPPVPPPPLGPPAPVVDLAARRRRRQGAALLVAAAAVVAVGIGVGTVVDRGDGDSGGTASAERGEESFDRSEPETAQDGGGAAAPSAAPTESAPGALMRMEPLPVSSDTFVADAERYRGQALAADQKPAVPQESDSEPAAFPCDLGSPGPGVLVPVLYDGAEAVLAYRPPTDDAQVVDLLQCGSGDVVRTTTLPVP